MATDRKSPASLPDAAVATRIWDLKYRLKRPDGTAAEKTLSDTLRRVARAAAATEQPANRKRWEKTFLEAMSGLEFIPAGRILAGAGTKRRVTLFNCFVMGPIEDDLSSIFENVREAALTMQQGGGIGHDFSTLRPRGAVVRSVGADASGPVSFMDVWDAMCRTIMSAGQRRGAMMATLRCDHPDIEEFISAKQDPARLRNFNLSVLVTDAFVAAVKADADWPLVFAGKTYRTLKARDLWQKVMRATYEAAEPGVIFIDRINAENNLSYCETIHCSNPCGEQPLPPYGACLLGSINLARLVRAPFEHQAALDEARLIELTATAVRFLDDIIDVSRYPLSAQRAEAMAKRRIGLGVTGLADALIQCGVRYGTPEAIELAGRWMRMISEAAYRVSAALAAEKGAFPLCDLNALLARPNLQRLPQDIRDAVATHGLRNGLLTSIAPTGTISLLAGNVSSGIEPVFDFRLKRRMLARDGTAHEEVIEDYALRLFRHLKGASTPLTNAFVRADELTPSQHLEMQAALQRHVDSSISKTINCPADLTFEDFEQIYLEAYELGLKGCTTYRPNAITGAVLSATHEVPGPQSGMAAAEAAERAVGGADHAGGLPRARPAPATPADVVYMSQPLERDQVLPGFTYKLRWPDSDHAIYVTLNDIERDGRRRPFEIFINSKNLEHYAWTVALTRMISAVFRRGGDVTFVVDELKAVFDPRGGQWMEGRYVPSLLAAIGGIIELHMLRTGFLRIEGEEQSKEDQTKGLLVPARAAAASRLLQSGDVTVASAGPHGAPAETINQELIASSGRSTVTGRVVGAAGGRPSRAGRTCPRCSMPALIQQEGCMVCLECGYSKCD